MIAYSIFNKNQFGVKLIHGSNTNIGFAKAIDGAWGVKFSRNVNRVEVDYLNWIEDAYKIYD
jgi:hypothetical protein